jgi:hypothetical protein
MITKRTAFMPLLLSFTIAAPCLANTAFSGTVSTVGVYGNGALFITLNGPPIPEPGCVVGTRIDVAATNPSIKLWLSVALAARTQGLNVYGAVNGCDPATGNPTLDTTEASFFYAY